LERIKISNSNSDAKNEDAKKPAAESRTSILSVIKTPLTFFALVVLVVEAIMGETIALSAGVDRTLLIVMMGSLMFLLVAVVAVLAYKRPYSIYSGRAGKTETPLTTSAIKITTFKKQEDANNYMKTIISEGNLDIVSDKFSWVSEPIQKKMMEIIKKGGEINLYLPSVNTQVQRLKNIGAKVWVVPSLTGKTFAHFTLIDRLDPGSVKLAVGCHSQEGYQISEIVGTNNPPLVTLANSYVEKLCQEKTAI
jgi:hypothetical protein